MAVGRHYLSGMRSKGTAQELEALRRLAAARYGERWTQVEVAAFLGVHPVTVGRTASQTGRRPSCNGGTRRQVQMTTAAVGVLLMFLILFSTLFPVDLPGQRPGSTHRRERDIDDCAMSQRGMVPLCEQLLRPESSFR